MAKKTRTELSTLALNTNLPDNTTEQITPTTERSQLTDERESVVNYKDDLGGATNAGKFLTVATDGESLTMVDEPSGVPDWVTFLSRSMRLFTSAVSSSATIEWTYLDALDALTIGGTIKFFITGKVLQIKSEFEGETIKMSGGDIKFMLEAEQLFRIRLLELTHYGDDFNMIAQDVFGASPLYNLNFKGRIDSSSNRYTFSSISGGKENATEDDKAGFLSFKTGIADGTLTERLRISSGGNVGIGVTPRAILDLKNTGDGELNKTASNYQILLEAPQGTGDYGRNIGWAIGSGSVNAAINAVDGGASNATDLSFSTGAENTMAERLRISSGGLVTVQNGIKFGTGATLDAYEEVTATLRAFQWAGGAANTQIGTVDIKFTRVGNIVNATCLGDPSVSVLFTCQGFYLLDVPTQFDPSFLQHVGMTMQGVDTYAYDVNIDTTNAIAFRAITSSFTSGNATIPVGTQMRSKHFSLTYQIDLT